MPVKARETMRLKMTDVSVEADGSFEGKLAVYNNKDLGGDIIQPGAFTKTLQENNGVFLMLWQHKTDCPIGVLTLTDGPDALYAHGQLCLDGVGPDGAKIDIPLAKQAYVLLKKKIIKGLSIGFDTIKDSVENGVRILKELALYEGSVCSFPMNLSAVISSVKNRSGEVKMSDFENELAESQLRCGGYQALCALREALSEILGDEDTLEDKLTDIGESIDGFKATILAWVSAYETFEDPDKDLGPPTMGYSYGYGGYMSADKNVSRETKAGRKISAATAGTLTEAKDYMEMAMGRHSDTKKSLKSAMAAESMDDATPHMEMAMGHHAAARKCMKDAGNTIDALLTEVVGDEEPGGAEYGSGLDDYSMTGGKSAKPTTTKTPGAAGTTAAAASTEPVLHSGSSDETEEDRKLASLFAELTAELEQAAV